MNSNENNPIENTVTAVEKNSKLKILKFVIEAVIAALVGLILILAVKNSNETTVKIQDPAIEQLVCSQLNKASGYITKSEAESITQLDLSNTGVQDLSELVKLPNLVSLDLSSNQYTQITLPEGLRLETLNISGNRISDLSFVSSVPGLKTLIAEGNLIKDLSQISLCSSLTVLNLNGNLIRDIAPVASLSNLEDLSLSNNKLIDISPISSLTGLKILDVSNNQIKDIAPLNTLTSLENLNLSRNPFPDLSPIADLPVTVNGNVIE